MNKLFKSKFLLGVLVVAAMFAVVGTVGANRAAASCSITTTLRVGSSGAEVSCLQSSITGLVADGKFGPKTAAAVKAWQASKGLVADGIFGAKSRAVWMGGTTTSTGDLCPNGNTLASNCMTPPAGGTPAGALCPNGNTIASNCMTAPGSNATGTNGYLSDFNSDSTNRVSTVYESETDKVVAGFRTTARLADQTVERVRVTFKNTDSGSSANLSRYISSASLWMGSTKLATIGVNDADRNSSTDVYTFNFSGLTAKVLRDVIGRFYVSVNAQGSIDTGDIGANWTVEFSDGGVLYSSPDGSSDTLTNGPITITGLGFDKFSANGVKATVGLSSSNLQSSTVKVESTTVNTNNVELLRFTVKASEDNLSIRKIPVQIAKSGSAKNVAQIVNSVKLYKGSIADANIVSSLDGSNSYTVSGGGIDFDAPDATIATTAGFLFNNLTENVASGTTVTYIVAVDLKGEDGGANYADDETLTASIVNADVVSSADNGVAGVDLNFSVQDSHGDQLTKTSTYRTGSAIGNTMTLRTTGAQVTFISGSFVPEDTTGSPALDGTINLKFSVKAFGDTDVTIAEAQGTEGAAPANNVIGYTLSGPTFVDGIVTSTDSVANAGIFTVSAGDTRTFTLSVKFNTTSGFTRLTINSVDGTVITNTVQTQAY